MSDLAKETAEVLISAPWVGDELSDVAAAVDKSFRRVPDFNSRDGPLLAEQYVRWRGYRKKAPVDWYAAWLNWVKKERNGDASGSKATGTPGGHAATGTGARHGHQRAAPAYDYDAFVGLKPSGTS
ncbi:hypothetical protein NITHO_2520001 [Nitrolancea hollandica Lb]|uniref:Uncharacterized protein n=1 Tax=Nitrolancea hollandica Lb TaxID=1129897 RepID=I4EG14_9BACT|nr:hypothetical protein NITHO_2520001 [Nitrolancea hollandica Lb]